MRYVGRHQFFLMLLGQPKTKRDKALQGSLAFFLLFCKPIFWFGTLIEIFASGAREVRAGQDAPLDESAQKGPPLPGGALGKSQTRNLLLPEQKLPPLEPLDSLEHVTHLSRRGDTLAKLFSGFGLPERERELWLRSVQRHYPVKRLPVGKEMHFYFTRPDPSGRGKTQKRALKALEIELNEDWVLAWEKGNKGIVFSRRERPYDVELKTAGAVVEKSLFDDGQRVGLDSAILSQLVDIFGWDIDFEKEIKKGDTFKVLYEERSRKGKDAKTSFRVLAAELINTGQEYFAIYFEKKKGKGGYYDLDGRSLARAFLRFPLEFINITSPFTHSRIHPILKVDRPHYGVDLAAKMGTPVRAVADGRILFAGWRKGGYGRMIEIQHESEYTSRYAHLKSLVQGIRQGVSVRKGQIIGYVGSSGLTTGPHLHFELYKDQEYVDPLKFVSPPEDRIEPALQRLFENAKQLFLAQLAATPHS